MIRIRLREYPEVTSTNDLVKRAIEAGESEIYAVRADVQTAGYGRQGRTWKSPAGGLYLSLLLRPDVEARVLPTLSLATAVAVRRALARLVAPETATAVQLKWPNDLVVPVPSVDRPEVSESVSRDEADSAAGRPSGQAGYRKLAGLSHELHAGALCVGIGANVAAPAGGPVEAGGKNQPIYLHELAERGDATIEDVAHVVLREFVAVYDEWQRCGIDLLLGEYNAHAYLTGRSVRIATIDGAATCEGVVRSVDEDGRLVLATPEGERRIASGEAHLV